MIVFSNKSLKQLQHGKISLNESFCNSANFCDTESGNERSFKSIIDDSNPGSFVAFSQYLAKFDSVIRSYLDLLPDNSECSLYVSPKIPIMSKNIKLKPLKIFVKRYVRF